MSTVKVQTMFNTTKLWYNLMTNSWAMLYDHLYDDIDGDGLNFGAAQPVTIGGAYSEDTICFDFDPITGNPNPKDETFWKYSEGKILREVEAYLSSTYNGHYVGEESKIQTLDLIDSIGDAEAFCRSNAIKYLSRFGKKNGKNPKDLLKVIHYAFLLYHFSELPFTEDAVETFSPTGR